MRWVRISVLPYLCTDTTRPNTQFLPKPIIELTCFLFSCVKVSENQILDTWLAKTSKDEYTGASQNKRQASSNSYPLEWWKTYSEKAKGFGQGHILPYITSIMPDLLATMRGKSSRWNGWGSVEVYVCICSPSNNEL